MKTILIILLACNLCKAQSLHTPEEWETIFKYNTLQDKKESAKGFMKVGTVFGTYALIVPTPVTVVIGVASFGCAVFGVAKYVTCQARIKRIERKHGELIEKRNRPLLVTGEELGE